MYKKTIDSFLFGLRKARKQLSVALLWGQSVGLETHQDSLSELRTTLSHRFNSRGDSFLNSPAYYVLTGRHESWVCATRETTVVVCRHPNLENVVLVFPEIGKRNGCLMEKVLEKLSQKNVKVQLARFEKADLALLEQRFLEKKESSEGSQSVRPPIGIHIIEENTLDWKYPIHILCTDKTAQLKGPQYAHLRQRYRKVLGKVTQEPLSDSQAIKAIWSCIKQWEAAVTWRSEELDPNIGEFYERLVREIEKTPDLFDGFIHFMDGKPVGFVILDRTVNGRVNLIANLCDTSIKGLSEYQIIETCRHLNDEGVAFLNMGGSETETLDRFKRKFMPVESIQLHSAEVEFSEAEEDIVIRPLVSDKRQKLSRSANDIRKVLPPDRGTGAE